jgi:1-pyrroline-5-carboxylate dehydrogenase
MTKKLKEYFPTSYQNFSNSKIAQSQKDSLTFVRKNFDKNYPLIINGKKILTDEKIVSLNPANLDEVIGNFSSANKSHAESAIQAASKAFDKWKLVDANTRANYLFECANIVKRRRNEINSWMISEVGKNFIEADADTAEAIDFLEYYGREMIRYSKIEQPIQVPGEVNQLEYLPLGVGAVIPPWNFPFAILVGMTSAAIVTGNTVIVKPSSDSPMMGWLFMEILKEAGVPNGVVNFIPGSGAEIGDYIVDHNLIRFVSFTGSAEIGKRIYSRASITNPGQKWLKRVVAEMGGKDGIIVDSEANLEDAADGVVAAAFGFQGQKCSACSRAIVDTKVYDKFLEMIKTRVKKIQIGDPKDNFQMGPVVSKRAYKTILDYIEVGKKEGKILCGGSTSTGNGYYIQPTVICNIKPDSRISLEEIFGPVLGIIKAKNFEDALKIANNTDYGLTGAVYSENDDKIKKAYNEFFVGNLYLNRKCTGALVGVHPFGGFNLSGTDSKAGGRDYLLLFMQAKTIATKIKVSSKK